MKVSLYDAGGTMDGGFTMPGMTLTSPLLLSGKVTSPSEAVHKQYVDTAATNLDAANIISGTIATARLPGLIGDVTSSNSSNNVVLNLSGVIAGDYSKVTVDAKGRVIVGLSLTEADLPNVSWSKITLGKPSTLSGYGITDGVSTVNGVITGNLTLSGAPLLASHAVTKQYADTNMSGGAKIVIGDIVSQVTSVTPSGFLRCNGGELSKTTYSALYAAIGDNFSLFNQPGNGRPWEQQYSINTNQSNDITGWATGTALPIGLYNSQVVVTKNRVYLLGGANGTGVIINTVYTAPINSDGTLGSWTTSTSLPIPLSSSTSFITKNRVYLLGGTTTGNSAISAIYTAPINADGTLGTWVVSSTACPNPISGAYPIITKNRLYLINYNYSVDINADGTLGNVWTIGGGTTSGLFAPGFVVTRNRIYALGGSNGTSGSSVTYTAPINTDGTIGTWVQDVNLPAPLYLPQVFVTKNRVYLLGGANTAALASVYTASINADGTLGTWSIGTSLPAALEWSQTVITKNRIYLLGGFNGSSFTSAVYTAAILGGLNDYSSYYDGSITLTSSTVFKLPDYTSYEKSSMYFYIKS